VETGSRPSSVMSDDEGALGRIFGGEKSEVRNFSSWLHVGSGGLKEMVAQLQPGDGKV